MCRYCNGTGKYQLLNRFVDCDQCGDTAAAPVRGVEESESADSLKFNFVYGEANDDEVPF